MMKPTPCMEKQQINNGTGNKQKRFQTDVHVHETRSFTATGAVCSRRVIGQRVGRQTQGMTRRPVNQSAVAVRLFHPKTL